MLRRISCFSLLIALLGLTGCSVFAPKPVPERYRAKVTYPTFSAPAHQTSSLEVSTPAAHAPEQQTPSYQADDTRFDRWEPENEPKEPTKKPKAPSIDVGSLPYAIAVPNEPNVVTLPPDMGSSAEIDVTGIAPGTAVEIPDPNNPGATIKFRVPEPQG